MWKVDDDLERRHGNELVMESAINFARVPIVNKMGTTTVPEESRARQYLRESGNAVRVRCEAVNPANATRYGYHAVVATAA